MTCDEINKALEEAYDLFSDETEAAGDDQQLWDEAYTRYIDKVLELMTVYSGHPSGKKPRQRP